ncbi:Hsp70 family protein [Chloroflexi bacterium TSY]|nr:Hsp70 family protein [Chloroflexi bacterium TSY]
MRIGIDFGTTHTSAAYYDGKKLRYILLDPHNQNPQILRSMIYVNREHKHELGVQAVQRFLEEDTGREVVFEERMVGTIDFTVAGIGKTVGPDGEDGAITVVTDVVIDADVGARGRLLQSIKTGLQSASYTGTTIFGRPYSVQELIALILTHVRKQAEESLGQEIREAVIGRPVMFSTDSKTDELAEQRLREAAELAGFRDVVFEKEPIAAALFYLADMQQPETLLVFDFGGGTLDLTVVRLDSQQRPEILAAQGVLIGGDDLDSAMMRDIVSPHFGTRSRIDISYDGRDVYLNEQIKGWLNRWQTIPQLSRPDTLKMIKRARQYGGNPKAFAALESLATQNYGFALFEKIEQAKRVLSEQRETTFAMQADQIDIVVDVTRRQFNEAIQDEVVEIRRSVRSVIEQAGISVGDLDSVVTTGGSSAIPRFQAMLKREFPDAHFVQSDAFGSVTGGLAIRAAN